MMNLSKFNETTAVGGQPFKEDLQQLKQEGFQTVINLRATGEKDQPLSPSDEGAIVSELGMEYAHLPVSMDA
ncbi:hypothetical protein NOC27_986 [Nitrosococcus oceani AFC27]|nr:sulfur transferase domain-containing protein [Nitrosococcus oceani]EDZ67659.1 hypothetical protein NOC27_986 [Nitrosococcus oceani AFC27]GEM21025.1 hypothetical protein NONS58_24540 [Nitrosococcus oceani]